MDQYKNNNQKGKIGWGMILIFVGAFLFLSNLGIIPSIGRLIGLFWPMIIIFGALLFHVGFYQNKKNYGLLMPGGTLLTIGIVCQSSMLWNIWDVMWPGFILAPAIGMLEMYLFGKQSKGLLIPVGILSGLSLLFFSMSIRGLGPLGRYILPAVLIFIGLVLLAKDKKQRAGFDDQYSNDYQNYNDGQNEYRNY